MTFQEAEALREQYRNLVGDLINRVPYTIEGDDYWGTGLSTLPEETDDGVSYTVWIYLTSRNPGREAKRIKLEDFLNIFPTLR
jgi:hypothetical protein